MLHGTPALGTLQVHPCLQPPGSKLLGKARGRRALCPQRGAGNAANLVLCHARDSSFSLDGVKFWCKISHRIFRRTFKVE